MEFIQAARGAAVVVRSFTAPPGMHAQAPGGGVTDVRARELIVATRPLHRVRSSITGVMADALPLHPAPLGIHARGAGRHHDVRAEEPSPSSLTSELLRSPRPIVPSSLIKSTPSTKFTARRNMITRPIAEGQPLPLPLLQLLLRLLLPRRLMAVRQDKVINVALAADYQSATGPARTTM